MAASRLQLAVIVDHLDPKAKTPRLSRHPGQRHHALDLERRERMRYSLCSFNDEIDRVGLVLYKREDGRTDRRAIARLAILNA